MLAVLVLALILAVVVLGGVQRGLRSIAGAGQLVSGLALVAAGQAAWLHTLWMVPPSSRAPAPKTHSGQTPSLDGFDLTDPLQAFLLLALPALGIVLLILGVKRMAPSLEELRASRQALRDNEARYRLVAENQTDLIVKLDPQGRFLSVSPSYCRVFGKTEAELLGAAFMPMVHGDDRAATARFLENLAKPPHILTMENRVLTAEGWRWYAWHDTALVDAQGQVREIIAVGRDVTSRKLAEEASHEDSFRFRAIVESSPLGMQLYRLEQDGTLLFVRANAAADAILGLNNARFIGKSIDDAFPALAGTEIPERFREVCRTGQTWEAEQFAYKDKDVSGVFRMRAFRTAPGEMAVFFEDISERNRLESRIEHLALTDALTGTANRTLLMERLGRALERRKRREDYRYCLLFVDLERFKTVNDSLGHQAGDDVLRESAVRIQHCVRTLDTVGRFGGDEFLVLLEDFESFRTVVKVMRRIQEALKLPILAGGREVRLGSSIGLAMGLATHSCAEELVRQADLAMRRARDRGRNRFRVFTPGILRQTERSLQLEGELERSLANGDYSLVFQPILSLSGGELAGFETLVRWTHPELGPVSPDEFIPLAEETGKIVALEQWIVREAMRIFAEWRASHSRAAGLTLSINLSARHIPDPDFSRFVLESLEQSGLPPAAVKFEITETSLLTGGAPMIRKLEQLRAMGVRFCIDDFGTGYSSMAYLNRLPIDDLKLDIAFVRHLETRADTLEIAKAITGLAHGLGLTVVAEGIETMGQRAILQQIGCEMGQGYLFARPMSAQDVETTYFESPRRHHADQ
ncbi:MAG: EAL domain-containing protein [Acidobacteriota bacterium]